jgi:hypothetical protein
MADESAKGVFIEKMLFALIALDYSRSRVFVKFSGNS